MATAYTSFIPEVLPFCDGAPEKVIINAIRNAAIEFCDKSWIYIFNMPPIGVTANVQDVVINAALPAATAIAKVIQGYWNAQPIDAITRAEIVDEDATWRTRTGTSVCKYLIKDGYTIASLMPIPSKTVAAGGGNTIMVNGLSFTLALKPTRASLNVPDWLYELYLEDIAHGALARMYAMPKKAWTNANLAGTHKGKFDDAISAARVVASRSFTRSQNRNRATGVARW